MRFKIITDSTDALTGMRLAGIEGVFADSFEKAQAEIDNCVKDEKIGVILVTENIASMCRETLDDLKLNSTRPLVAVVPGKAGDSSSDNIMRYVQEAIGIKSTPNN